MTKDEFLRSLQARLSGLPREDVEERLSFYREMIEDRVEEGFSEEEAVAAAGTVDEIVSQILADMPLAKIAGARVRSKKQLGPWEIVLLVLGSPLWLSLLLAAVAVVISVYVSVWSVVVSLWAVFASVVGCSLGGILAGVLLFGFGKVSAGLAMLGAALVCAGLSVWAFFGCRAVTKGLLLCTKKPAVWIKRGFLKKEGA